LGNVGVEGKLDLLDLYILLAVVEGELQLGHLLLDDALGILVALLASRLHERSEEWVEGVVQKRV
jgi:hypothetical protein